MGKNGTVGPIAGDEFVALLGIVGSVPPPLIACPGVSCLATPLAAVDPSQAVPCLQMGVVFGGGRDIRRPRARR